MNNNILIIDDNALNLKLMHAILSADKYNIKTAANAADALAALKSFFPKLILMDIQMPDMDGFELTRLIKADTKNTDIIIIAITAYAMPEYEEQAMAAGCSGYMSKPIDSEVLLRTIREYMNN
jgi:two-component system, cell cycle response regulator DivK